MTVPESSLPLVPGPNAPTEPLISVGTITAVITAAIGLLVTFGLDLSDDQQAAILGLVGVVAPIAVALWGRTKVWSPASVHRLATRQNR